MRINTLIIEESDLIVGEMPELDQTKHPFDILGEQAWSRLSSDERAELYSDWVHPQTEWFEKKERYFSELGQQKFNPKTILDNLDKNISKYILNRSERVEIHFNNNSVYVLKSRYSNDLGWVKKASFMI